MLRSCVPCIMPDTKEDLPLDEEGLFNAYRAPERRRRVEQIVPDLNVP